MERSSSADIGAGKGQATAGSRQDQQLASALVGAPKRNRCCRTERGCGPVLCSRFSHLLQASPARRRRPPGQQPCQLSQAAANIRIQAASRIHVRPVRSGALHLGSPDSSSSAILEEEALGVLRRAGHLGVPIDFHMNESPSPAVVQGQAPIRPAAGARGWLRPWR